MAFEETQCISNIDVFIFSNMIFRKPFICLLAILFLLTMKRKSTDSRNETRKLKRRAQALLKKNVAKAKAEQDRLEGLRHKKAKSRMKKFRENVKKR